MNFINIVVGAGLTGATIAEQLVSRLKEPVLVIDKRKEIGGNAADCWIPVGDNKKTAYKQLYGAHIFHTKNEAVLQYLSEFTEWTPYEHKVLARYYDLDDFPIPVNLRSIEMILPNNLVATAKKRLIDVYGYGSKINVQTLQSSDDYVLQNLGEQVYDIVFRGYSEKQWGSEILQTLDNSVLGRVPIKVSYDDRYFGDEFQAIPANGYTKMVEKMLNNRLIFFLGETKWDDFMCGINASIRRVFFTGGIDDFFHGVCGKLSYRSVKFDELITSVRQQAAVVNFPGKCYRFTRNIDFSYLSPTPTQDSDEYFARATEFPCEDDSNPAYPIPNDQNKKIYEEYLKIAAAVNHPRKWLYFAGRLGAYQYLNMDEAVERALNLVDEIAKNES